MDIKARYTLRGWSKADYIEFLFSVGGIFGIALSTLFLAIVSLHHKIPIPQQAYSIPIGFMLFAIAWFFDSIAHRTIYKDKIDRDEFVIHNFMVYASGTPLLLCFVLAFWWPALMMPFILCFLFMKTMYSVYDEFGFHWTRYRSGRSDMIEMTAHCFQFIGNILYDVGWYYWIYFANYRGVNELLHVVRHMLPF